MENIKLTIGERIQDLVKESNKTQAEICNITGISKGTLSEICNDKAKGFDYRNFIELAKVFNVSTDYILGLTDVKTTDTNIQAVCNYTKLNEETISYLNSDIHPVNTFVDVLIENFIKNSAMVYKAFHLKGYIASTNKKVKKWLLAIDEIYSGKKKIVIENSSKFGEISEIEGFFTINDGFKYSFSKFMDNVIDEYSVSECGCSVGEFDECVNKYFSTIKSQQFKELLETCEIIDYYELTERRGESGNDNKEE